MSENESQSFDLPGIGEFRAKKGTSTAELAGAVKFWHEKYSDAHRDGFLAGSAFTFMFMLCSAGVYYILR